MPHLALQNMLFPHVNTTHGESTNQDHQLECPWPQATSSWTRKLPLGALRLHHSNFFTPATKIFVPGFSIYLHDRAKDRNGGVATLINSTIKHTHSPISISGAKASGFYLNTFQIQNWYLTGSGVASTKGALCQNLRWGPFLDNTQKHSHWQNIFRKCKRVLIHWYVL